MTSRAIARVLFANGVNLDRLGFRPSEHYGTESIDSIETKLRVLAKHHELEVEFYQSNDEGAYLQKLTQTEADVLVINPGAWTHTSLALSDRLESITKPIIEVHLSNPYSRSETIRHQNYVSRHVTGTISGFAGLSYELALLAAANCSLCKSTQKESSEKVGFG